MLYQIADDFIDNVVTSSCQLAKHRNSNTLEVKDVQLNLGMFCLIITPANIFVQGYELIWNHHPSVHRKNFV